MGSKLIHFLMEENHNLALAQGKMLDDPSRNRRLVGRHIYLTITRPELYYAIHMLSQFMQEHKEEHMDAARWVLKNLEGTPGYGILLHSDYNLQVHAYYDADWGACPLLRGSLIRHLMTIGRLPIS